jgi:hypothetical protein
LAGEIVGAAAGKAKQQKGPRRPNDGGR